MSFRPEMVRGARPAESAGQIEYRLARNVVVREFQRGRLSRIDVCDAHPELLRAARNLGEATAETCPICETAELVHVSYVFGSRLPPGGRCVADRVELLKAVRTAGEVNCYVVEVCSECGWNHLARSFALSRRRRA